MRSSFPGNEDYIILACDGLWDTVEPDTAVSLTNDYLLHGNDRVNCAKMLVKEAKARGSMDNISVIVVFLDDHRRPPSHPCNKEAKPEERSEPDETRTNDVTY